VLKLLSVVWSTRAVEACASQATGFSRGVVDVGLRDRNLTCSVLEIVLQKDARLTRQPSSVQDAATEGHRHNEDISWQMRTENLSPAFLRALRHLVKE
jgi:hypothetical protein